MMYGNNHMTSGGWIAMVLLIVVILALLVGAVVWAIRKRHGRPDVTPEASAMELLDRRLATGEIKTDQYVDLRRTLLARPGPAPTPK